MAIDMNALITVSVFLITMVIIFLRPKGLNEAYPAAIGALIVILAGVVNYSDILDIFNKIGEASITIVATIVMAVILESFGFFHWAATRLSILAKGSGYRLYWYIQLLCFCMTILFNNDGSILITTPILILLLRRLNFKLEEQIPYLLSGALIATASSAPIGVSNIVNLIALKIVHMTLYMHTAMMFVPCTMGLAFMSGLMFIVLKKRFPKFISVTAVDIEENIFGKNFKVSDKVNSLVKKNERRDFMFKILAYVFLIRYLIFGSSFFNVPIQMVAVLGSAVLLALRWYYLKANPKDVIKKVPWQIFVFAFSMYVIIYGLNNVGLTTLLVKYCEPIVTKGLFQASFLMGGLMSVLSNVFNNHPALMIGTITLTHMGLAPITLKTIYLANIVGSDMGSLLLPIGTLASLLWMNILKRNKIKISWLEYVKVTIRVIPLTVIVTLFFLYYWVQTIFV